LIQLPVTNGLQRDLRDELLVRPKVRLEAAGVLERTEFKAKRIVDKRQSA
jgi:phenylacetate-coenzyme A ligase PaaK-like adenylate-forming protein